jgi:hypothetical protein
MQKIILFLLLFSLTYVVYPQDTLVRIDGSSHKVKILEVAPGFIRYLATDQPHGPEFLISKEAVARIIFENGTEMSFNEVADPGSIAIPPVSLKFDQHNMVSLNAFELALGAFTLNYEGISPRGLFSGKISVSLGFYLTSDYDDNLWGFRGSKLYSGTLAGNYYPFGQERLSWFIGTSIKTGKNKYFGFKNEPNADGSYRSEVDGSFFGISVHNGFKYYLSRSWVVVIQFGLGRMSSSLYDKIWFPIDLGIGYKF